MDPTTGLDEIIFGTLLVGAGCLFLVFREPLGRVQAGYYQRMAQALPWLPRWVYWPTKDSTHRWLVIALGLLFIVNGIGFIVWALIWGWP